MYYVYIHYYIFVFYEHISHVGGVYNLHYYIFIFCENKSVHLGARNSNMGTTFTQRF